MIYILLYNIKKLVMASAPDGQMVQWGLKIFPKCPGQYEKIIIFLKIIWWEEQMLFPSSQYRNTISLNITLILTMDESVNWLHGSSCYVIYYFPTTDGLRRVSGFKIDASRTEPCVNEVFSVVTTIYRLFYSEAT